MDKSKISIKNYFDFERIYFPNSIDKTDSKKEDDMIAAKIVRDAVIAVEKRLKSPTDS